MQTGIAAYPGFLQTTAGQLVLLLAVFWSVAWKGVALWTAARRGQLAWYVVLLIVNTVGLLEIVYILVVGRRTPEPGSLQ